MKLVLRSSVGRRAWRWAALSAVLSVTFCLSAQTQQRMRLILKDGSYQVVLSYKVKGKVVQYVSAERDGETEDVPLALVDLAATEQWAKEHATQSPQRPVLSPELAREEADRAARTPEVAPNLRLPDGDSVLALDQFESKPELVPMAQEESDLNKETAHAVEKKELNPLAASHQVLALRGTASEIQLHGRMPVFYARIGNDDGDDAGAAAITVDTHGAAGRATPGGGAMSSGYVIERLDVRNDSRAVNSFRIALLGTGKKQPDIIEVQQDDLHGGHWTKLIPSEPLLPGEYALIEVLNDREINLNMWDFGVHPDAKENSEAIKPEVREPAKLKSRE